MLGSSDPQRTGIQRAARRGVCQRYQFRKGILGVGLDQTSIPQESMVMTEKRGVRLVVPVCFWPARGKIMYLPLFEHR